MQFVFTLLAFFLSIFNIYQETLVTQPKQTHLHVILLRINYIVI